MIFTAQLNYPWSTRKGDKGNAVGVLQLNLGGIAVDGDFGPETNKAVRKWQREVGLFVDGVAGPDTQRSVVVKRSAAAAKKHSLPAGMLESIAYNESGFILPAVSLHPSDMGLDIGAFMRSTGPKPGDSDFYLSAFNIRKSAEWTAARLRAERDRTPAAVDSRYFADLAQGDTERMKWLMVVLSHNFPYAAHNIPRRGHIYNDPAQDDQPAGWIVSATGGRLGTPREWVGSYVQKATLFTTL